MTSTENSTAIADTGRSRVTTDSWLIARLKNRDLQRILINIGVILIVAVVVQVITGDFFLPRNLTGLFVQIGVVAMIAAPVSMVMVAGSIDISVAGIVVLSGVIAGLLAAAGVPLWLAFVLAIVAGIIVGLVNSVLVLVVGIPSMIATIGTLYICQGVGNLLTNGLPVGGVPTSFATVGSGSIGSSSIPIQVPMVIGVLVLFILIQRYTSFGRFSVATGSNRRGAFLNGVPVRRTMTLGFVFAGAVAGWGGVVYASRIGTPIPIVDQDLLFQVIVACVVGGTSLIGGRGTVFGSFTGAMLIAVVNNSLDLLGVSIFWQYITLGLLLVLAVGFDTGVRELITKRRWVLPDILSM
jgi:ribose transport system permease protein